jgi:hypothetical protein
MDSGEGQQAAQFLSERVHPTVADVFRSWQHNPDLRPLWQKFVTAQDQQQVLDAHAEGMIARHFMHQGYSVQVVDMPIRDRGLCLAVAHPEEGEPLWVHVRRMWTRGRTNDQVYNLRPLQLLERIERPLLARLHLHHYPTAVETDKLLTELEQFLTTGQDGHRRYFYDAQGFELGRCDLTKATYLTHVRLIKYVSFSNRDQSRLLEKLYDAYAHFSPDHDNLIMVTSSWPQDIDAFQPALRTFWGKAQHGASTAVGWFHTLPHHQTLRAFKLWLRQGHPHNQLLQRLTTTNDTAAVTA